MWQAIEDIAPLFRDPEIAALIARWLPVAVLLVLIPVAKLVIAIVRRTWIAGLSRVPVDRERATQRIETLLAFVRSTVYFVLSIAASFQALHALFPNFDPMAATGALSIVALILTAMFRDVVVDIVKGLDILFGGHYSVGDFVRFKDYAGYVIDFQLKYTKLRSAGGEEILVNNAACVPSCRFPEGWVANYLDVPLARAADQAHARELLDQVAGEMTASYEVIREPPSFDRALPNSVGDGVVVRYLVGVLPGADWVLSDAYVPRIEQVMQGAEIPLSGAPRYFFLNDLVAFRRLFRRG
ncbi:MAG: mechanosensitive ion channel family protein [Pirellulales bacterium]|nr:mechanosensitive ion channel family protein [Pirellulales bacterium]